MCGITKIFVEGINYHSANCVATTDITTKVGGNNYLFYLLSALGCDDSHQAITIHKHKNDQNHYCWCKLQLVLFFKLYKLDGNLLVVTTPLPKHSCTYLK